MNIFIICAQQIRSRSLSNDESSVSVKYMVDIMTCALTLLSAAISWESSNTIRNL